MITKTAAAAASHWRADFPEKPRKLNLPTEKRKVEISVPKLGECLGRCEVILQE